MAKKLKKAAKAAGAGFNKAVQILRSNDPEFDEDDIDIEESDTVKDPAAPKAAAAPAAPRKVSAANAMKFKVMPDEKLVVLQRYLEKPDPAAETEIRSILKQYGYGRELPKKVASGVAGKPFGAGLVDAPLKEYVSRALLGQVNRQKGAFKAEDLQAELLKVLESKKVPKEIMERIQSMKPKDFQKYMDDPEKLTKLTGAYVGPASETYAGKTVGGVKKAVGGLLGRGGTAEAAAELEAMGVPGQSGIKRLGRTLSKGGNLLGIAALGGSAYLQYQDAKKRSAEAEAIRLNAAATARPASALREQLETEAKVANSRFLLEKQDPDFVERVMAGLFGSNAPPPDSVEMSIADLVKPRGQANRTNVVEEVDAFLAALQ